MLHTSSAMHTLFNAYAPTHLLFTAPFNVGHGKFATLIEVFDVAANFQKLSPPKAHWLNLEAHAHDARVQRSLAKAGTQYGQ